MAQANDLASYLQELDEVSANLRHAYRELGTLQAGEVRNRAAAWLSSNDTTVNGRRDYSAHMVAETKGEVLELQGDIAAMEITRDNLKLKIDLVVRGLI